MANLYRVSTAATRDARARAIEERLAEAPSGKAKRRGAARWRIAERPSNAERVNRAATALTDYVEDGGGDPASLDDTLIDLMADLMHWAENRGVDYLLCADRAWEHWREETGKGPIAKAKR